MVRMGVDAEEDAAEGLEKVGGEERRGERAGGGRGGRGGGRSGGGGGGGWRRGGRSHDGLRGICRRDQRARGSERSRTWLRSNGNEGVGVPLSL